MPLPSATFSTERTSGVLTRAIKNGRQKQILNKAVFDNTDFRTRLESFTVAGSLTSKSILRIQGLAHNAIERGVDYRRFADSLGPETLKRITSPRVVYSNAINNAYHRARYETSQKIKAVKPFLRYKTFGDEKVRPPHALMNNKVARIDDPFWLINYPPNGHKCRCVAVSATAGDLRRLGLVPKTLQQIETETRTAQIAAGVPPSKIVRPLADPGWRGSYKLGEPGSDALVKLLKKYDSDKYASFITPRKTVSPAVFTQARPIPKGKPFTPISQWEAEEYTRKNFADISNYDGLELGGMRSITKALSDAVRENKLPRFWIAHTAALARNTFASAGPASLNLNPAYLKSNRHFRLMHSAARNVAPYAKKAAEVKLKLAQIEKEIKALKSAIRKKIENNIKWRLGPGYIVLRSALKRLQIDKGVLQGIRSFKREIVGSSVRDIANHEIGHILTGKKAPGVWSASKAAVAAGTVGSLRFLDASNKKLRNKFSRYNFESWMTSDEHRAFRRQWLSEYSEVSLNEYIAESFTAYKRGGRVHPEVRDFIERILNK
jgi:SPP1 gp7 family putative phage head morphogenesis protein